MVVDLAPDARTMKGDERLVSLTLKNLLDNAIKFTAHGSITIRSYLGRGEGRSMKIEEGVEIREGQAEVDGISPGGERGTGIGAAEEHAPTSTVLTQAPPSVPAEPDYFVLEIQDTGIGIPLEDQERVFERFYTVNRSRGGADRGTGLGLSIVKHAVTAMQGAVSLTSVPNAGTTVRCTFPMSH
jgi:signal transduction histidine kinase